MLKLVTCIVISSALLLHTFWYELRTQFRTTEDKLEGFLQLNGGWMEDIRCESLGKWDSECFSECCTGWSHGDTSDAIKSLFLAKDSFNDNNSTFIYPPELKTCLNSQNIKDFKNSYTSEIKNIKRVFINRGVIALSGGKYAETNIYTFYINSGCAPG